jgi:6-phosphogluconolactonase
MLLVVGGYNDPNLPGIHLYQFKNESDGFEPVSEIAGIKNPSYLEVINHDHLLAISEDKEGNKGKLCIYQLQNSHNGSNLTNEVDFSGAGSCYVSTDLNKMHAFIANYGNGSLTVISLPKEGNPGKVVQQIELNGSGPDTERQDHSHIHAAILSRDGHYLYCSDLGSDSIYRFSYMPDADLPLQEEQPAVLKLPAGSGPRHLTFSKDGRWLYVITELSGEIFVFDTRWPADPWVQRISLGKSDFKGKPEGGDIQVHPDGKTLYASLRGDYNEILVFALDPLNGRLSLLQRNSSEGRSPRCLLVCEQQGLLLASNEQGNCIAIFYLLADGRIKYSGKQLDLPTPTCLKKALM